MFMVALFSHLYVVSFMVLCHPCDDPDCLSFQDRDSRRQLLAVVLQGVVHC